MDWREILRERLDRKEEGGREILLTWSEIGIDALDMKKFCECLSTEFENELHPILGIYGNMEGIRVWAKKDEID